MYFILHLVSATQRFFASQPIRPTGSQGRPTGSISPNTRLPYPNVSPHGPPPPLRSNAPPQSPTGVASAVQPGQFGPTEHRQPSPHGLFGR